MPGLPSLTDVQSWGLSDLQGLQRRLEQIIKGAKENHAKLESGLGGSPDQQLTGMRAEMSRLQGEGKYDELSQKKKEYSVLEQTYQTWRSQGKEVQSMEGLLQEVIRLIARQEEAQRQQEEEQQRAA